ncbi:hypothetical protein Tco_0460916 [Tanacetum coccineum]
MLPTTNMSYPSRKIRRTASGLRPYHFTYPERKLTMKEMLYKFIDEGKREHAEMRAFISDFQTTNEILFKERNNSLIELRSRWYGPNVVKTVYPYGTIEITDKNGINFNVNGQRLKIYHERHIDTKDKEVVEFEEDTT